MIPNRTIVLSFEEIKSPTKISVEKEEKEQEE